MSALKLGVDISGFDLQRVGVVLSVRDSDARPVSTSSPLNMSLIEFNALITALDAEKSAIEVSTRQSQKPASAIPDFMPGLRNANSFDAVEPEVAGMEDVAPAEIEASDAEEAEVEETGAAEAEAAEAQTREADVKEAEAKEAEAKEADVAKAAAAETDSPKAGAKKPKARKAKAAKTEAKESEAEETQAAETQADETDAARAEAEEILVKDALAEEAGPETGDAEDTELEAATEENVDTEIAADDAPAVEEEDDGGNTEDDITDDDSMPDSATNASGDEGVDVSIDHRDSDWEEEDDYSEWQLDEDEDTIAAVPAPKQNTTFEPDPDMIANYKVVSKDRDAKDDADGENVGFFGGLRRSLGFKNGLDAVPAETVSKASDADRNVAVRDIVRKHIEGRSWE